MGILASALSRKSVDPEIFREFFRGTHSKITGKHVTLKNAIEVSTVYAIARVIGEGIAQPPFQLMQSDGKVKRKATEHPLYDVLALRPNAWQTAFEYREGIGWHIVLCGQHFSFINRVSRNPKTGKFGPYVAELIPFEPGQVTVRRASDYTLSYRVTAGGSSQDFPAEAIWHIRGPSWNGWQGLEPVVLAREAIGLAMATEEAAGKLHQNGVRPSGVYSMDSKLDKQQYEDLSNWVNSHLGGAENTGKALILDRGAKWLSTQMTGIDAQTLEMRRMQIEELCRFARVMPIMVGYSDKATTYASASEMFLAHLVHTLAPWYERIEQSADVNLLTDAERGAGYYTNFVEEGLLRGSAAATAQVLLSYVNGGLMYPNEGRDKLDLNPDPDPLSNKLRVPANITGLPQPGATQ